MRWFLRGLELAEWALNILSSIVLFFLLIYVTAEVLMRTLFNSPLPGHLEMSQLLIAAAAFLGLSYVQAHRGHVNVDIVMNHLSPGPAVVMDTFVLLLSLITIAIIVWYSGEGTLNALQIGDVTPTSDVPTWWSKAALPVGGGLLCLRFLVQIAENVVGLLTGQPRRPGQAHAQEEATVVI